MRRAALRVAAILTLATSQIHSYAAHSLGLAWDANTDGVTAGYFVHTQDAAGNPLSTSDVGASTSATVAGLIEGNTYAFYVTAYDAAGNQSGPSNTVSKQIVTVPVADNKTTWTTENQSVPVILSGSDSLGLPLTYAIATSPAHGTLSGTAPNLNYTPASNYYGSDSFTYTVFNGTYSSAPATVSITVKPYAPTANPVAASTSVNRSGAITLSGVDPNNLPLTFTVMSSPANGALSGTPPNLTYTPAANYYGSDSFTYIVNNGYVSSTVATVAISVQAAAPTASALNIQTLANQAVGVTLSGNDSNGLPLSYQVASAPANGTLSGTAPNLTYTPAANYYGTDSFTYTVNNGLLTSAAVTVSITVNPPVANNLSAATMQGTAVSLTLTGKTVAGRALTFTVQSAPASGTLSGTAPNLTYTPNGSYSGNDKFTFVVNDGVNTSVPATVSISIAKATSGVRVRKK